MDDTTDIFFSLLLCDENGRTRIFSFCGHVMKIAEKVYLHDCVIPKVQTGSIYKYGACVHMTMSVAFVYE
jgi:hypothetical protein